MQIWHIFTTPAAACSHYGAGGFFFERVLEKKNQKAYNQFLKTFDSEVFYL
jgi:hypothetical protein